MTTGKAEDNRRLNYHYMADALRMLEWDLHQTIFREMRIPDEWHEIARQKPSERKTRVTLRLDEGLVRFFRSMGPNWQVRVNRLMSVWMHPRLCGVIRGGETMDYMKRRKQEVLDGNRPEFGEMQRGINEINGGVPYGSGKGVPMDEPKETFGGMSRDTAMAWLRLRSGPRDEP